jgi:hypothetical protein
MDRRGRKIGTASVATIGDLQSTFAARWDDDKGPAAADALWIEESATP